MMNKEKNFVSAVIYVHNAEKQIQHFLRTIINELETHFEHSEIICVNDFSSDSSAQIIRDIGKTTSSSNVTLLNLSHFHGLEIAMNAGTELAIGDFVFEFDAPCLSLSQDCIMDVYRKSLEGYDAVSAIPDTKMKLQSRIFYKMLNLLGSTPFELRTESFRILSRRLINRVSSSNGRVFYRKIVYANSGLKTYKLLYKPLGKEAGHLDKAEKKYRLNLAVNSAIVFTKAGELFSVLMTSIMMVFLVAVAIYALVLRATANPVPGWTFTICFLSLCFLGLFAVLTVALKYLSLLVELLIKRKTFSFESIEKISGGENS